MLEGFVIGLDAVVKARKAEDGRRLIEVEASNESVDSEGDVILQRALLDSAPSFVKSGHLDIDHISEIGARLGIANPEGYIIGRPTEVKDLGSGRTSVVGEIMRSADGKFDPDANKFDAFWKSMQSDPPVAWRASIYGFPKSDGVVDCREEACDVPATRFLIKGIDWRSLALTRNPVNTALKGIAKIVTAKAYAAAIAKGYGIDVPMLDAAQAPAFMPSVPRNMDELWGQYVRHIQKDCPHSAGVNTTATFKDHFLGCCGALPETADVLAHALMHAVNLDRRREG